MRKYHLIVAAAVLFLLAACVPGATPTVRSKLPAPINFQVVDTGSGYHVSWMYIADLAEVSAFNLYREETLQNGARLGAENRVFRITWGECDEVPLCLTITDAEDENEEPAPIGAGTLECNATGCYFGYTDTEGLNPTSTYRYYLRMINADGELDDQIIITDEERRLQEAAEEAPEEAGSEPSDEGPGEEGTDGDLGDEDEFISDDEGEQDPIDDCESGLFMFATEFVDPCEDIPPMTQEQCEGTGYWNDKTGECDTFTPPGDGIACENWERHDGENGCEPIPPQEIDDEQTCIEAGFKWSASGMCF